ncbi:hypothetical protein GGS23DRAFT_591705 [Durotheca rogersii]|uniref:uncharacterized protein n=1 Tax=Durotheca rogersii TaxID=419775 RepID=UPI0022206BCA|nr:uncharacterized protein GGS23DRAFT_591705 [Durotheca rogersii]KAI5867894.1 hypothetical protein GGS23DRAFT_591705 [Durotheca rogersii]
MARGYDPRSRAEANENPRNRYFRDSLDGGDPDYVDEEPHDPFLSGYDTTALNLMEPLGEGELSDDEQEEEEWDEHTFRDEQEENPFSDEEEEEWDEDAFHDAPPPEVADRLHDVTIPRTILKKPFVRVLLDHPPLFDLIHYHVSDRGVDYYFSKRAHDRDHAVSEVPSSSQGSPSRDKLVRVASPSNSAGSHKKGKLREHCSQYYDLLPDELSPMVPSAQDLDFPDFDDGFPPDAHIRADGPPRPIEVDFNDIEWDRGATSPAESPTQSPRTVLPKRHRK